WFPSRMQRSSLYLLRFGAACIRVLVTHPRGCGCQPRAPPGIPTTDEHSPPPHKSRAPRAPPDQADARLRRVGRNESVRMTPDLMAPIIPHLSVRGPRKVVLPLARLVREEDVFLSLGEGVAERAAAHHGVSCFHVSLPAHGVLPPGLVIQSVTHGIRLMHQRRLALL